MSLMMSFAYAGPMDGVWMGEYVCPQGKTTVALTITESPVGGADVIFQFSGHPMNPGIPMGSFQMKAGMDPFSGALVFKPTKWLVKPAGYQMVGLKGKMTGPNLISGTVTGAPGCTVFSVQRGAAPNVQFNVNMNLGFPSGVAAPAVAPPVAAPPKPAGTCQSVLLEMGHSSSSLIHCDDDTNQACAVALLRAGHSPAALVHCSDISNPTCAVQVLKSGKSPASIIHCD
jgi:hypothetical protein